MDVSKKRDVDDKLSKDSEELGVVSQANYNLEQFKLVSQAGFNKFKLKVPRQDQSGEVRYDRVKVKSNASLSKEQNKDYIDRVVNRNISLMNRVKNLEQENLRRNKKASEVKFYDKYDENGEVIVSSAGEALAGTVSYSNHINVLKSKASDYINENNNEVSVRSPNTYKVLSDMQRNARIDNDDNLF